MDRVVHSNLVATRANLQQPACASAEWWRATRPKGRSHLPAADSVHKSTKLGRLFPALQRDALAPRGKVHAATSQNATDLTLGLQAIDASADERTAARMLKNPDPKDLGPNVFERDSPRARATLRAFLCEFLIDDARGGVEIRRDIDLRRYSQEASRAVTNATVQEICVMQPHMTSLNVSYCKQVTDAALWAVSRHCAQLRSLHATACQITRVGLRALTLGCRDITLLELSQCVDVGDSALSAIAAGCPSLKALHLSGCQDITDDGLAVLGRGCRHLSVLNVSACRRVGEFGDRALLALGRYCPELTHLDMFGCAHVQDAGVVAVARGCTKLSSLKLSGCRELTGLALEALSKQCIWLKDLSIAGCKRVKDVDLCRLVGVVQSGSGSDRTSRATGQSSEHEHGTVPGCCRLTRLDVSGCDDVRAHSLAMIADRCKQLHELSLRGCAAVTDDACRELASRASRLRSLDLSECPSVSETGVETIAHKITGLAKLDVSNCKRVSRRFLVGLVEQLKFADLARDFVGVQPKPNANALRCASERHAAHNLNATTIERVWRGALARIGLGSVKRRLRVERGMTQLQAAVRARFERKRIAAATLALREQVAATWFAAAWRGMIVRRDFAELHKAIIREAKYAAYALGVQRTYRAHVSRKQVAELRLQIERTRLEEARLRAREEVRAITIQARLRGNIGRAIATQVRSVRNALRARAKLEARAALVMTSLSRGKYGRHLARERRAEIALELRRWRLARDIQRTARGMFARVLARRERLEVEMKRKHICATRIQAAWRAGRARFLATIAAAMGALRAQESWAVIAIQASVRKCLAVNLAVAIRQERDKSVRRERAVVQMQRILRGHFGRTKWEIAKRLSELRDKAAPLYKRLEVLRGEARTAASERDETDRKLERYQQESRDIMSELKEVSRTGHPTWDTARLTGYPQRYVTQYLKERLVEIFKDYRARVAELSDLSRIKTIAARDKERAIRETTRELAPLTIGLAERARKERVERLRNRVRTEQCAAIKMQSLLRLKLVQRAFSRVVAGGHAQWELLNDSFTGEDYYWNSISGVTRWSPPLDWCIPEVPPTYKVASRLSAGKA